jgi:DNA-binding transcriptional MerR regulator
MHNHSVSQLAGHMAEQPSMRDLAEQSGLAERTIRFFIKEELLHPANRKGPKARYPTENRVRLELVQILQESMTLSEIKALFDQLGDEAIQSLLETRRAAGATGGEASGSVRDYIRGLRGGGGQQSTTRPPTPAPISSSLSSLVESQDSQSRSRPAKESWQRIRIGDDVEIHVRSGRSRQQSRQINQLIEHARSLLSED